VSHVEQGPRGDAGPLLRGNPRRLRRERIIKWLFLAAATTTIVISVLIVVSLVGQAADFIRGIDLSQLWADGWYPRRDKFGVATILVGSFLVTAIAMVVAAPLGLGAAIYLSEYARPRARKWLKPILEVLAGIPSVVVGFFALTWITPNLVHRFVPGAASFNFLAAGIGVGILTVPLIASVAEDAMSAVPRSLREAAFGLGARRITTSLKVVVPAAVSGIVAALIIGVSRAIGETMVVAIAAGGAGGAPFTADPRDSGLTMTAAIANLATGSDQVVGANNAVQSLFFVGLLLFVVTFGLNFIGGRIVRRIRQRY